MKSKIKTQFFGKYFPETTKQIITPKKLGDHRKTVLSIT